MNRIWQSGRIPGVWWFRLCGIGLAYTDHAKHRPLFSERHNGQPGIPRRLYIHYGSSCLTTSTWRHP